ncbi:f7fc94f9-3269-4434-ac68-0c9a4b323fc4 [Thermothielavioides terrestris]|uniref:F7fc94f9-3269-4434-ac68-0c9a4b323fc4 n=1 Tax=Thermothielavioides terrestris TaxID=2587410 RepID=A0A3S4BB62_9PEZI|nr:f7fc94f9-3269-4434-ac68-0c9a4b323fc4 [Thermothielavioides terrestris]
MKTENSSQSHQGNNTGAGANAKDPPTRHTPTATVQTQTMDFLQEPQAALAADLGPGFVDVNGDVGGPGHNETAVDVIAVPCPGADPLQTWSTGPELGGDTSALGSRSSLRRPSPWVTRDLRISANIARVFLYRHRALEEGLTLESLSEDLLDQVSQMRNAASSRPLFFIAHSIGGLVVKSALVKANHHPRYQEIVDSCHGVTFFGTPHRGSSFMSMPHLKGSIQELLHLQATLPRSLSDQLRVNNSQLIGLHDQFVDMASELRLWSFYETRESLLSGSAAGLPSEVQFDAPLVSVKSALVDLWQEDVYAMDSDHAHLASFGPRNAGILDSYLADLAEAIRKAALLSSAYTHTPLHLRSRVKVEIETFATLARTQGLDFSRLFDYDNWVSKQIQNRNSDSQPAYLKAMCKYLPAVDRPTSPRISPPTFGPSTPGIMPSCLYVYLPFLHFDTYRCMIRRRKLIARRRYHGRAKPVPKWVAQQDSLELKAIWEYIGYDPPLNCRRTLDQFGHPSLRDTNSRDDDQMLYKLTKKDEPPPWSQAPNSSSTKSMGERSVLSAKGSHAGSYGDTDEEFGVEPEPELKDGLVLMVDQLWLWSIDMTTLTTFFSRRESSPTEGTLFQQADLRNSVYNELNGDLTGRTENTLDLAALIVWHAVTVLLDRSSHPDLEIFRIFDEGIGILAERMTQSMKRFRIRALGMEADDDATDSEEDSDVEGDSPAAIRKRHKRELERSERENREHTSALLELRDFADELTTLQKLFETQESTIRQMKEIYMSKDFRDVTKNGQDFLDEALEYLDDYKQQTAEMLKRVDTTRNDYEKMLEMVQRQAQVDEVRWSRLQAELASSQNLSVMIFTTFTVIFLPLTFFTGLFGMNTTEWQEQVPSLKEIGAISLPASALLIMVSLVAAFNYRVQSTFRRAYVGIKDAWKMLKRVYAERLEPASRKAAKRRRREEKKKQRRLREAHLAGHDDQGYDFWAMVKRQQRDMLYRIPDQNVNSSASANGLPGRTRQ